MILVQITINGTVHYVSNQPASIEHWYYPYVISSTSPQYQTPTEYGGYTKLVFGDMQFSPDLFSSDWPPPKQCPITIYFTTSTEYFSRELFSGYAHLESFSRDSVSYSLYDKIYTKRL